MAANKGESIEDKLSSKSITETFMRDKIEHIVKQLQEPDKAFNLMPAIVAATKINEHAAPEGSKVFDAGVMKPLIQNCSFLTLQNSTTEDHVPEHQEQELATPDNSSAPLTPSILHLLQKVEIKQANLLNAYSHILDKENSA